MKLYTLFGCFIIFLIGELCLGAISLPRSLNSRERERTLELLGFGSAPKILDNPYPLGGYSGIEIGLSTEFIPMEDIATLGTTTQDRGTFNYFSLSFAKGLYYNIDLHVNFTPSLQDKGLEAFGGQVRWGFYELSFFPLSFSAIIYGSGANFSNLININTLGAAVIGSVNLDNVALYFGNGRVRTIGKFIGGDNGITDDKNTDVKDLMNSSTILGINIDFSKVFVAFEVDRYSDSFYSGKLGYRF